MTRWGYCNNKDCPQPRQTEEVSNQHILGTVGQTEDINVAFDRHFKRHHFEKCRPCQGNKQDGVVQFASMEPLYEHQPPPFFHIDNVNGKYSFEEYDSLPNEVKLGEHVYEKKMVVMHNPPRTTRDCGHFTSFIKFDDHWLHYDGMIRDPSKRFKPVKPKDYVGKNLIVNSCTYTKKNATNWN